MRIEEGLIANILDECKACESGKYTPEPNSWTSCESWSNCEPGSYVKTAPSSSKDRECEACGEGTYTSTVNAASCADVNGCEGNLCTSEGDAHATCNDVAAPGTGYECVCSDGYHDQDGVCSNINSCAGHTCASGDDPDATCVDNPPPQTGYTCSCSASFTEIGSVCKYINGCDEDPCSMYGDTEATCSDLSAPSVGNDCACSDLFVEVNVTDSDRTGVKSCKSVDLCAENPCRSQGDADADCAYDSWNPADGYTCICTDGYEEKNGVCAPFNACSATGSQNPCSREGDDTSVCIDLPPPRDDYNCTCTSPGFEFKAGTCVDVDGCVSLSSDPCASVDVGASCQDVVGAHPAGTPGFYCSCTGGFVGDRCQYSDATTCNDHGTVSSLGVCACDTCFTGENCDRCADACASSAYPNCTRSSPQTDNSESKSLDAGATAGIVILVVVIVALILLVALYVSRRASRRERAFVSHMPLHADDIGIDEGSSAYDPPEDIFDGTESPDPSAVPFGDKRVQVSRQDFIAL
eukprot:g508.t1